MLSSQCNSAFKPRDKIVNLKDLIYTLSNFPTAPNIWSKAVLPNITDSILYLLRLYSEKYFSFCPHTDMTFFFVISSSYTLLPQNTATSWFIHLSQVLVEKGGEGTCIQRNKWVFYFYFIFRQCYRLIFVCLQTSCWKPDASGDGIWKWGHWKLIRTWGQNAHDKDWCSYKKKTPDS